jgi:hypothetical protein
LNGIIFSHVFLIYLSLWQGHNWGKVSEYVGTRTMSQVKNYFYDNKKQILKRKEKGENAKPSEVTGGTNKVSKSDKRLSPPPGDTTANTSVPEDAKVANPEVNNAVGMCMPINQGEKIASAEEQFRQQLLLEQQSQQYMQQQLKQQQQQQQHHEMMLQQHMQRMHDAQRLQEAQRMEEARQEMIRRQQQQQWLAQLQQQQQQQQQQQNQHHQRNEWVDRKCLITLYCSNEQMF